jgi:hypothetical protein
LGFLIPDLNKPLGSHSSTDDFAATIGSLTSIGGLQERLFFIFQQTSGRARIPYFQDVNQV